MKFLKSLYHLQGHSGIIKPAAEYKSDLGGTFMKSLHKIHIVTAVFLSAAFLLTGCGGDAAGSMQEGADAAGGQSMEKTQQQPARETERYGGVLAQ